MNSIIDNIPLIDSLTSLIIFEIADREFAADLKDICAIINPFEIDKSFKNEIENLSFIKINTLIINLVNVQKFLGTKMKFTEKTRILSYEIDDYSFGLIVHKIKEIITLNEDLKTKLVFFPAESEPYLLGRILYEGRSFLIPNLPFLSKNI